MERDSRSEGGGALEHTLETEFDISFNAYSSNHSDSFNIEDLLNMSTDDIMMFVDTDVIKLIPNITYMYQ